MPLKDFLRNLVRHILSVSSDCFQLNMSMEEKNALKNQKYFVDAWLEDPYFVGWLSKVKIDSSKARCFLCHKTIELLTSG